jgi:hypothetical protein
MSELRYQIFGSKSSKDYDVLLAVDELKSIDENHKLIKEWNELLTKRFVDMGLPEKKVNCNLGVLHQGQLIKVFKGTYDEVNNSLYYTYGRHTQNYHNMIRVPYDRINSDFFKHLKLKRCYRFLLSFYSRVPELREDIKLALRGDFIKRLEVLTQIDFTKHTAFPKKKDKVEDIYKVIAFQLAQTLLLFNGVEIFSKEGTLSFYPKLENAILRKPLTEYDLVELNILLYQLLVVGSQEVTKMENLNEEIFGQ